MTGRFNLGARRAQETADLNVLDPKTDEPTGWLITFAGPGHPQTVTQEDRQIRERLDEENAQRQALANGTPWKPSQRSRQEREARNVAFVVDRIVSWTSVDLDGEEDVKFSAETATRILDDPQMAWLYGQCSRFLLAEKSFIAASAKA